MTETSLHLYTIMPPDTEHLEEICEDVRLQYENGVSTCALFSMTLVPEGDPVVDKVGPLCQKYMLFKKRLSEMGIPCGILVQASIGHGWVLGELFPYQQYVPLLDGKGVNSVCPSDEGFRAYIGGVFEALASCAPDHIMLDDDFRLLFRPGGGCACPLHLGRMEALFGARMDREALLRAVRQGDTRVSECFVKTQKDSLLECARVMRDAIDRVDPTIPGSFCTVGTSVEFGAEIAEIMAGKGNPTVLRINNANYTPMGAKYFTRSFLKCAASVAKLEGKVDVILAETDTCPQNRYSTSARSLHTHFTGSILEGAAGAKHWITRMIAYEPNSGRAYRRILGKHRGFYQALTQIVPTLRPRGFRIPVGKEPKFPLGGAWVQSRDGEDAWSSCVLERLGLPLWFSSKQGGVVCLEGERDLAFSDTEILEMLHGSVMLASDCAERLIARGFGEYLGVEVRPWKGKTPTHECISDRGNRCAVQKKLCELVPLSDGVRVLSTVLHSVDKIHFEPLFPGSCVFDNALGGKVFTFAGSPKAEFNISEAFSFLNESRKMQLIHILDEAGELPLYYPGDEEVYLRAAEREDGGLFCAVFNLSSDPIEETELYCQTELSRVRRLMADGSYEAVPFEKTGERTYLLQCTCEHLDPVILLFN